MSEQSGPKQVCLPSGAETSRFHFVLRLIRRLRGCYLETYPRWPAVVYEEDDPDVPETVQRDKGRVTHSAGSVLLLVRFWDTKRTW